MSRINEPLSAAQIHTVYATEKAFSNQPSGTEVVQYSKTSAYKREPLPSGRFSPRTERSGKSKKY